jgi:hypothetical protein
VSNSVMLVTFMNDHWKGGSTAVEAAIEGAKDRLRPILMTACAMSIGMVPMALALERGRQMQAPLGRAVIGGLVMSTFATLLILPSIFAMVVGKRVAASPSIYPDDPESKHYDPRVFINEFDQSMEDQEHPGSVAEPHGVAGEHHAETVANGKHHGLEVPVHQPPKQQSDDVIAFMKQILDEARSRRHDMTTHYTVDDLLMALGFAKSNGTTEPDSQAAHGSGSESDPAHSQGDS